MNRYLLSLTFDFSIFVLLLIESRRFIFPDHKAIGFMGRPLELRDGNVLLTLLNWNYFRCLLLNTISCRLLRKICYFWVQPSLRNIVILLLRKICIGAFPPSRLSKAPLWPCLLTSLTILVISVVMLFPMVLCSWATATFG